MRSTLVLASLLLSISAVQAGTLRDKIRVAQGESFGQCQQRCMGNSMQCTAKCNGDNACNGICYATERACRAACH
jgi:hypothetical protein